MKKILATVALLVLIPSIASASTQILLSRRVSAATATTNLPISFVTPGTGTNNSTVGNGIVAVAGTFSHLYAYTDFNPGAGTWTVQLFKGATGEAPTCTISSASPQTASGAYYCSDTTDTFTIAADNTATIQLTPNSSPAPGSVYTSIQFSPTTANQTILPANAATASMSTTLEQYTPYVGTSNALSSTEADGVGIMPETGTFNDLYVALGASVTSGSYVFTLRNFTQNATSSLACTVTTSVCSDTTDSYSTGNANDGIDNASQPVTPSNARGYGDGVEFTPTVAGDFDFINSWDSVDANASARYYPMSGFTAQSNIEASSTEYSDAMIIKGISAFVATAPGVGKSRIIALRQNNATSTDCTVTISGTSNYGSATCNDSISQGDHIDTADVPVGTPATSDGAVSYIAAQATPAVFSLRGGMCTIRGHIQIK